MCLINILSLITFISLCLFMASDCLPRWASKDPYCEKAEDCPLNYCCVIGFTRYSVPRCQPMGQIGNWCRMYNEPENKTLAYPSGEFFEYSGIYTQFCPCDDGLVCEDAKCMPSSHNNNFDISFFYDD